MAGLAPLRFRGEVGKLVLMTNELDPAIEILRADWRDLTAVRALEKVCFPLDAWPLLDMIGVLTIPGIVRYKMEEAGELIGFVAGDIRRISNTGWIATICVHPAQQGRGLGSYLLELCEREMGMPRVKLSVRESNQRAIELYRRNGYIEAGRWKRYYKGNEDGIVMEKYVV